MYCILFLFYLSFAPTLRKTSAHSRGVTTPCLLYDVVRLVKVDQLRVQFNRAAQVDSASITATISRIGFRLRVEAARGVSITAIYLVTQLVTCTGNDQGNSSTEARCLSTRSRTRRVRVA